MRKALVSKLQSCFRNYDSDTIRAAAQSVQVANKANGRITHPSQKIHSAQEKQPMYQRLKNDPDWEKFSIVAVALVQTTIRICTERDHDLSYP